jgi:hypothetical protein
MAQSDGAVERRNSVFAAFGSIIQSEAPPPLQSVLALGRKLVAAGVVEADSRLVRHTGTPLAQLASLLLWRAILYGKGEPSVVPNVVGQALQQIDAGNWLGVRHELALARDPIASELVARTSTPEDTPSSGDPKPGLHADVAPTETQRGEGGDLPAGPFVPLTSWNEILAALNEPHGKPVWKNDAQTRDKIRNLNELHNGPICPPQGKGRQPSVDKAALLMWWNGLKELFDARNDKEKAEAESTRLTVTDSHNYGASGKVVPGIGGSKKRRRAKGKEKGKEGKK